MRGPGAVGWGRASLNPGSWLKTILGSDAAFRAGGRASGPGGLDSDQLDVRL